MDLPVVHSFIESITNLTTDAIGIIILVAALALWAIKSGKRHIVALIAGLYVAILLSSYVPYLEAFVDGEGRTVSPFISGGVFLIFTLISYFILRNSTVADFQVSGIGRWFQALFLAAAATGLLLFSAFHTTTVAEAIGFHPLIESAFRGTQLLFWWLVVPLIVLFFTTRRSF